MINIALGLGTNLGSRLDNLNKAINELLSNGIISDITISSLYETEPLIPKNAPDSWNKTFYNIVIKGLTKYDPFPLLQKIKEIEHKIGRKKRLKWAPREIDIDILIYENQCINLSLETLPLTIPHKDILNRDFFLLPLAEIWPDLQYPADDYLNTSLLTLAKKFAGPKNIINITKFSKISYK